MTSIRALCVPLIIVLITANGCGDDNPITPEINHDNRLLGTWTQTDEDVGVVDLIFESGGTLRTALGPIQVVGTWSTNGDQLTVGQVSTFTYEISNNELAFTAIGPSISDLYNFSFRTDDNATVLTGVTWTDVDDDPLVFSENGRYTWGAPADPYEEGTWKDLAGTLTITDEETLTFSVNGNQLTLSEDGEDDTIFTRK